VASSAAGTDPEPLVETVGAALDWSRSALHQSPSASLDAQLLLAHVLRQSRAWLLAHPEASLTPSDAEVFLELIQRRTKGEPVAYLRGHVSWFDLDLRVAPSVLIPRPETELLVEASIELIAKYRLTTVADLGTGSGAIAIALARTVRNLRILATDVSREALEIARRNAEEQGVAARITFMEGSLLVPIRDRPDLIVANLPYLSDDMMATLPLDVQFEPETALAAGPSGLELYEELFHQLKQRGWRIPFILEIDPRQGQTIEHMILASIEGTITINQDYTGHDRILIFEPRFLSS
jgi:release factor glutamine methyltransferase